MPARRKGTSLGRRTKKSAGMQNIRAHRRDEQIQEDNADVRVINTRRAIDQQRQQVHRAFTSDSFLRLAFQYEPDVEYYAHSKVDIGTMDKECPHCHALKFKNEPAVLCCASGKVQLPEIETPPEPLYGLLIGMDPDSSLFLKSIRTFNSCFQMTSFGATEIVQNNAANGAETNKNVSSKDYYAYRLMIRCGQDNVILRCRELCQQFMVDMYVKIESERLRYLRHNQQKLRAEEYIHLRDAIANNADTAEIGNSVILPSSYIGSPRHMQEYIQDAMAFVREYGRPCFSSRLHVIQNGRRLRRCYYQDKMQYIVMTLQHVFLNKN
ncbi:ATP-dependent DNA helicase [Caerostris extrusa]|uniref:ATP-dependent DNA helicase n=1 Tax=Caerostris extrusa TaxID=172846 RepID=A0AAV4XIQ5_CAEEX|nr:ATP-dependent DNA helicase [Caerostris extrusa]